MTSPQINEETQRLIEPADLPLLTTVSLPKRRLSPHSTTATESPRKDRTNTMPEASSAHQRAPSPPALQQADRNTFEESFAAALSHRHTTTYDGQFDNNTNDDMYGDRTPLLNSCYSDNTQYHHRPAKQTPRHHHAPLEPASKSKPSRSICLWHEISHNSQYTRPVAELLREVLEDRYPAVPQQNVAAGEQRVGGSDRRRWWRRVARRRPTE